MLVGDFRKIPTRDVCIETDTGGLYQELDFPSDLYFADLYDGTGNFSSWDTNGNGKYGEWPFPEGHAMVDAMDFVPDVHVARLACLSKAEVRTQVSKIILYETMTANASWFSRMVVAGGDTFDKAMEGGTDYNEGEVTTQAALDVMDSFTPIKIWASLGNLTTANIQSQIDQGAGFLYLCGHGSPKNWGTHNNGDYKNWTEGMHNSEIRELTNRNKCPVLMVGGCHNSEIDVAPINLIKGILTEGRDYFTITADHLGGYFLYNYALWTWSWVFVKDSTGAIASIGSSGYGCVDIGDHDHDNIPDCTERYDGWLEIEFFRLYSQNHLTVLGQTYGADITEYAHNFPVLTNRYDAKVVATHVLLGDPSLLIGGYK